MFYQGSCHGGNVLTAPDTLSNLIMAAVEIILAIAEGLVDAMPRLMEAVPLIISLLVPLSIIDGSEFTKDSSNFGINVFKTSVTIGSL